MKLVIVHGYLLQGTGSNIYVANIAKAWCSLGHQVVVVCQDPDSKKLPFVEEYVGPGEEAPSRWPEPGKLLVVVPDIEKLLPVYVYDKYEGYTAKCIPDMSSTELERHIFLTALTLRKVCLNGADRVLANHALLGPVITARALKDTGIPYDVKIHGSSTEYVLVPHPRYMPYAKEGLSGAGRVFTGTPFVKERVLEIFADWDQIDSLQKKLEVVPPGMDPDIFGIPDDINKNLQTILPLIRDKIKTNPNGRSSDKIPRWPEKGDEALSGHLQKACAAYDQRVMDADLVQRWPEIPEIDPVILYFGKFIPSKGVGELMTLVPAIFSQVPNAWMIFVGFGSMREHLELMLSSMACGNKALHTDAAFADDFASQASPDTFFRKLEPAETHRVLITGMLEHNALSILLPRADIVLVPSKWKEAFGMVNVEALASGVLPISQYHSGLKDIVDHLISALPELKQVLHTSERGFFESLPARIKKAMDFLYPNGLSDRSFRTSMAYKFRKFATDNYSWKGIGKRLLQKDRQN